MNKTDREKAVEFLNANKSEKLNEYIKGYVGASDLAKEIGVDRSIVYLAFEDIDKDTTKKREQNQYNILLSLVERINRCIPYQSMDIDSDGLMGKTNQPDNLTDELQKDRVRRKLVKSNFDLKDKGYQFIIQSKIDNWYRDYLVHKEIQSGEETAYKIAKKYGIIPRKIYGLTKFFEDNKETGRFIKRIPIEQQQVFVENIKMFEEYKNGSSVSEIAKKFSINEYLVEEVVDSLNKANDKLQ